MMTECSSGVHENFNFSFVWYDLYFCVLYNALGFTASVADWSVILFPRLSGTTNAVCYNCIHYQEQHCYIRFIVSPEIFKYFTQLIKFCIAGRMPCVMLRLLLQLERSSKQIHDPQVVEKINKYAVRKDAAKDLAGEHCLQHIYLRL